LAKLWTRIVGSWKRSAARYDAARRVLERRIWLDRWFPHAPLALALALLGQMLVVRAAGSVFGVSLWSVRLAELESHVAGAKLGALPDVVIGGLLLVTALGLLKRSRSAWLLAVLSLGVSLALGLAFRASELDGVVIAFRAVLLVALLVNRAHFSARSVLIQNAFGVYALLVFLACATALTLRRGSHFEPEIGDPLTALYFVVVTMSSVGFGDFVAKDPETRGFVLTLIVTGVFILGTAVSVFLMPIVSNRLRVIIGHQENPVNRSKHYVVIGTSPLARNAVLELEKRNQAVTLILGKANDDAFYENRDVVIGDATDLDVLRKAGAHEARGVLALSTDDSTNGFVVLGVNELDPSIMTVAALNDSMNKSRLERTQPSILLSLQVLGGQLLAMALTGERVDEGLLDSVLKIHTAPATTSAT
jgi:voltage-gated potassium channel